MSAKQPESDTEIIQDDMSTIVKAIVHVVIKTNVGWRIFVAFALFWIGGKDYLFDRKFSGEDCARNVAAINRKVDKVIDEQIIQGREISKIQGALAALHVGPNGTIVDP